MLYTCTGCATDFDYPDLKPGVDALCRKCSSGLEPHEAPLTGPRLLLLDGDVVLGRHPLGDGRSPAEEVVVTIGRASGNHIVLEDLTVSSLHAEVSGSGGQYYVRDLDSANGTLLNDVPTAETRLADGDRIEIGPYVLRFEHPDAPPPAAGVSLSGALDDEAAVKASFRPGQTVVMETQPEPERAGRRENATSRGERARLEASNLRLQRALAATAELSTLRDETGLLERLAEQVFELFPAERIAVFLRSEDRPRFRTALAKERSGQTLSEEIWISRTIASRVMQQKLALVTSDARTDSRLMGRSIFERGLRSVLVAPLLQGETVLGLVWADAREEGHVFREEDLPVFSGLAQVAAVALSNARLVRRTRSEAETRIQLARYLPPELVQQAMKGEMPLEMGGEVREVTILFSDLRGFTRVSEKMDPAVLVTLLNAYFTRMVNCIFDSGGILDKFIGDAVMALWGVPVARKEDPLLAVRTALAMQRELELFNRENEGSAMPALAMGIGVHTGQAVVGNIGSPKRMDRTVIGSAVNLASRIESQTGAGDVFVSAETFARLDGAYSGQELPPIRVKNVSEPVRLYRVRPNR